MKPYSLDLRKKVFAACDRGEGTSHVARRFGVSESWVRRLKQRRRENGEIAPRSAGGDRRGKFDERALDRLRRRVEAHPDATLEQLQVWVDEKLGIQCSIMAVCRALKRIGMTFKKKSLQASERSRPDVVVARKRFTRELKRIRVKNLVFLDESGARTNMTRLYGRSMRGERCQFATPHGHWQTMTMISALRCTGVIAEATMVFDGPTDGTVFRGYVEQCLAPALDPGDIVVMDNLSAHKVHGVVEALQAIGADALYLPAYSPDLNPIEKLWSKIKSCLRRAGPRQMNALVQEIGTAFRKVATTECTNYFVSCGYATDER